MMCASHLLEGIRIHEFGQVPGQVTIVGLRTRRAISTSAVDRLARASGEVGGGVAVERWPTASIVEVGRRRREMLVSFTLI